MWDPGQYALFADHRGRPFADLLSQVAAPSPGLVVDLGCGDGPLTLRLAARWAGARVVGVDSSAEMLDAARAHDERSRVEWVQARAEEWDAGSVGKVDVLVTNAVLQWVPGHLDLIPRWLAALAPGGWFAMQVPANFDSPSHRLMREVAARHARADQLRPALRGSLTVADPTAYLSVLAGEGLEAQAWQTTYLHVLDPGGVQRSPVLEWVRGTGLRPVLELLTAEAELQDFLDDYVTELDRAYPRTSFGVVFPFTRTFAVGRKPGP